MSETTQINGRCDARFEPVRQAFEDGFASGREQGAAVCLWYGGECVVDLWAGFADRRGAVPWQADTLACFFSVSKAITATCLLHAVDEGRIDLDDSVATYWPEFAQAGKHAITVRQLMCHQAGLPGLREPVPRELVYDWQGMCEALAAEEPWWPPGSTHGYHARTFGYLLGEVLRRATGSSVGSWLRERICGPAGVDVYIGLTDEEMGRCADMLPARIRPGEEREWSPTMQQMREAMSDLSTPTGAAFQNPAMGARYMNQPEFRRAQIPAVNGHGTARGVAQFMAGVKDTLSPELLDEACLTQSHGRDEVLKSVTRFGLGYMLNCEGSPIGWDGCFGHAGAGGSLAFSHREADLGYAFVMNQMQEGVVTGGNTAVTCAAAVRACIESD